MKYVNLKFMCFRVKKLSLALFIVGDTGPGSSQQVLLAHSSCPQVLLGVAICRAASVSVLHTDVSAVLITADQAIIGTANVSRTDHTGTVICHGPRGRKSLLHLLDQGQYLGMATGPGPLGMASVCREDHHSHKADF